MLMFLEIRINYMFETEVCSKKQIKENKSRYIFFFILVVTKVLKFKGA